MKKLLSLAIMTILLGTAAYAAGEQTAVNKEDRAATVDIKKVVESSSEVKALKKEHQAHMKELEKMIKKADKDINAQKTNDEKKALAQKYVQELNNKKAIYVNEYQTELAKIDKDITATIVKTAGEKGYNVVVSKKAVIYSSDDITKAVIKKLK